MVPAHTSQRRDTVSSSVGEDEEVVFEAIVSFLRQREKKERRKPN